MRLNKFLGKNTILSRRKADTAISNGRVKVNGKVAKLGVDISSGDTVTLDGKIVDIIETELLTILLNKPVGYVCSKDGQGSKTVYDLLPAKYRNLNIAGRLDKDSSGLVVLTNNGNLLNELTHPSKNKQKIYEVTLDKSLRPEELTMLTTGVNIGDNRLSRFKSINEISSKKYEVILEEGRNRQIRRTFEALRYKVTLLQRTEMGNFKLQGLVPGDHRQQ